MEKTFSFPVIFNRDTGKTSLSSGRDSIKECLYLLLNSMAPELLGDPLYGGNILECAFELKGKPLYETLKTNILRAIMMYEPRVTVNSEDITFTEDGSLIIINLRYYIKQEGTYDNTSLALETNVNF